MRACRRQQANVGTTTLWETTDLAGRAASLTTNHQPVVLAVTTRCDGVYLADSTLCLVPLKQFTGEPMAERAYATTDRTHHQPHTQPTHEGRELRFG